MTGFVLLTLWIATGIVAAASRRIGSEPAVAWLFGGAVLGPFWLLVTLDQSAADTARTADRPAIDPAAACDETRHSDVWSGCMTHPVHLLRA